MTDFNGKRTMILISFIRKGDSLWTNCILFNSYNYIWIGKAAIDRLVYEEFHRCNLQETELVSMLVYLSLQSKSDRIEYYLFYAVFVCKEQLPRLREVTVLFFMKWERN